MINQAEAKSVHEKVKATLSNCPVGYRTRSIAVGPETLRLLKYHDRGRGITSSQLGMNNDFYGVPLLVSDFMVEGEIRVSYVPDPPPSWTVQVKNNLTGDILEVGRWACGDLAKGDLMRVSVEPTGWTYTTDSWVPLP